MCHIKTLLCNKCRAILLISCIIGLIIFYTHTKPVVYRRGLWVWNTSEIIQNDDNLANFIAKTKAAKITDIYLYLRVKDYIMMSSQITHALSICSKNGLHVWGMEGWRGYFHDAEGPDGLYATADALVEFNANHKDSTSFEGFVSDMEPQDVQGHDLPSHFHNGIPGAHLTSEQADDRENLMEDWVDIHRLLNQKMHHAGLRYAAAVFCWTDNYYGEPLQVIQNGNIEQITEAIMENTDEYILMTYNTDPVQVASMATHALEMAENTRRKNHAVQVFTSIETQKGLGMGVSYGDEPMKNTQHIVLSDILTIQKALAKHPSFAGVGIHDWLGWSKLAP